MKNKKRNKTPEVYGRSPMLERDLPVAKIENAAMAKTFTRGDAKTIILNDDKPNMEGGAWC